MDQDTISHVIFPAGPGDALALAQTHVAAWRESYRGLIADSYLDRMSVPVHARRFERSLIQPGPHDATLAVADRDGIVGYASGGPSRSRRPGEAEIHTLYVRLAAQRQGLGERLLIAMARVFADQGARSLMISTLRDNLPARRFYEHLGGEATAPRREPGPGGLVHEVSYLWPDIGALVQ
ncbi:GNAT family N-acetyltransferase [Phenylobacterium aquaticum]|uniref:GNAT family N-acetyltransferase n=1 Tax=Phenylobacterium aquaticum TaxID=1763816 RepID=UPI0026EA793A|nr:GNAT family N-acetyltransferase [Phenylobacterium aquaticum]